MAMPAITTNSHKIQGETHITNADRILFEADNDRTSDHSSQQSLFDDRYTQRLPPLGSQALAY
jgi:hypothetical protein